MNENENDNEKDFETENSEPSDHDDDEFSDEFNFDDTDDHQEDALAPDEFGDQDDNEPLIAKPEKKRNLLIPFIVGAIAIVFIGWKVIASLMEEPEPVVVQEEPKVEPKPQPAPEMPILPEAPKVTIEDKKEETIATLQRKIEDQDKLFKEKMAQIESNVTATTSSLQSNQQSLATFQQQLNGLTNTINQLNEQIKSIRQDQVDFLAKQQEKRVEVKPKEKAPKPKPVASSNLVVHAIIPGRAWLRNTEGKTITVAEGDSLGDLGKVLKIDAPNGVVVTTSGVVLR